MAAIATEQWGSGPNIYLTFSYEYQRSGSAMQYRFTVTSNMPSGWFEYPMYLTINLNGTNVLNGYEYKGASGSPSDYSYTSGWYTVNKTSGSTPVTFTMYSGLGSSRSQSYSYNLTVTPAQSLLNAVSNFEVDGNLSLNTTKYDASLTDKVNLTVNGKSIFTGVSVPGSGNATISLAGYRSALYSAMANTNSASGTVTMTTYNGSTPLGSSTKNLSVTVSSANPDFTSFTYEDTNSAVVTLTGSKQRIVPQYSAVKVSIPSSNKAAGKKGASITKYVIQTGSSTADVSYSTGDVSKTYGTGENFTSLKVTAVDTRSNQTAVSKTPTIVEYKAVSVTTAKIVRDDLAGKCLLSMKGYIWNGNFGAVQNGVTSASYRYKEAGSSTWVTGGTALSVSVTGNTMSITGKEIQGDLAGGFDAKKEYTVELTVKDKLASSVYTIQVGTYHPAITIEKKAGEVKAGIGITPTISEGLEVKGTVKADSFIGNFQDSVSIGSIQLWSSSSIPENWLLCDGRAVTRSGYSELFSTIGTTFGAGDGSTTFNVPNLSGRVPVGKDGTADFNTIGKVGGEKTHQLTTNEMPSHTHGIPHSRTGASGTAEWPIYTTGVQGTTTTLSAGGNGAHNNLQPYFTVNYIIKAKNSISNTSYEQSQISDVLTSTSAMDVLSANMGRELNSKIQYFVDQYGFTESRIGIWDCKKYNNGWAECWCTSGPVSFTIGKWENIYATSPTAFGENLPFTFAQIPYVYATLNKNNSTGDFWLIGYSDGATKTHTGYFQLGRGSAAAIKACVNFYVRGRWK